MQIFVERKRLLIPKQYAILRTWKKSDEDERIMKRGSLLVFCKNTGGCFFFNKIEQFFVTDSGLKTKIRTCVPIMYVLYYVIEKQNCMVSLLQRCDSFFLQARIVLPTITEVPRWYLFFFLVSYAQKSEMKYHIVY